MSEEQIVTIKGKVSKEISLIKELIRLDEDIQKAKSETDKDVLSSQIELVKNILKNEKEEINEILSQIYINKPLDLSMIQESKQTVERKLALENLRKNYMLSSQEIPSPPITKKDLSNLERTSLKRIGKKEATKKVVKEKKPSKYVNFAVRKFSSLSRRFIREGTFDSLKRSLVKANMQFIPENYVSAIILTTFLSIFASILLFVFFLFFNFSLISMTISLTGEPFEARALKFFWIIFVIPLLTLMGMYVYPSLEKKSIEAKINQELPFVTIHMSSIAGAMKDPSKMFGIIISTGEYPNMQKEFAKIINEINLYGYDLVSALRNSSFNCPSGKLAELYNGISTTISAGGDLSQFFEKRAETLLFDYKIERDKYNKATETFMDIYLSVVIAAPMILMLLLIIMRVSGLGISLSTQMISLITVLGVVMANIFFLIFLYIKQPAQ
ncbi:MAG: type II secretion system F family protein [archaeon]